MKITRTTFQNGFTMIETLVAIAILMISIAGPLTIAQKGLTASIYARDQITASFLAQDTMEYIKNIRDRDVRIGSTWTDALLPCISSDCISDTYAGTIQTTSTADNVLYYGDETGYRSSAVSGLTASKFSRKFRLYYVPGPSVSDEVKAVVTVSWKNGTVNNVVTLEGELFNVTR